MRHIEGVKKISKLTSGVEKPILFFKFYDITSLVKIGYKVVLPLWHYVDVIILVSGNKKNI